MGTVPEYSKIVSLSLRNCGLMAMLLILVSCGETKFSDTNTGRLAQGNVNAYSQDAEAADQQISEPVIAEAKPKLGPETPIVLPSQIEVAAHAVFRDEQAAALYMGSAEHPTPERILASWPRASNHEFILDPTTASVGSSDRWYIDSNRNSFVQPVNSSSFEQILSPERLDVYEFKTILTSTHSDDDFIGVVAAADIIDGELLSVFVGVQHNKTMVRNNAGSSTNCFIMGFIDASHDLSADHRMNVTILAGNDSIPCSNVNGEGGNKDGWKGRQVKIRVLRDGPFITAHISAHDGDEYLPESELTTDLRQLPGKGALLAQPARYGYATLSQADSTYLNYEIISNQIFDVTRVYAAKENKYWHFMNDAWVLQEESASAALASSQNVTNIFTQEYYKVSQNSIEFTTSKGIPQGEVELTLSANQTHDIAFDAILASFPYEKVLTIGATSSDHNIYSTVIADKLRVVTHAENGHFYVLLQSGGVGSDGRVFAFRKVNVKIN